jgi:hypothetical protein
MQGFRIEVPQDRFTDMRGIHAQPGWWWDPSRSGTGMFVQRRGAQTGISYYGSDGWAISVWPLTDQHMYAVGHRFRDGSCAYYGCPLDYLAPTQIENDMRMYWDLSRARSGLGYREDLAAPFGEFVAMAIGGTYRHELSREGAPVAVPELSGSTWVFVLEPDSEADEWQRRAVSIRFDETQLFEDDLSDELTLTFGGTDAEEPDWAYDLTCHRLAFGSGPRCTLEAVDTTIIQIPTNPTPMPTDPVSQWQAHPNDIGIDRLTGRWRDQAAQNWLYVRGFRLIE